MFVHLFIFAISSSMFLFVNCGQIYQKDAKIYTGRHGNISWPQWYKHVKLRGDVVLGAISSIHERQQNLTCGQISKEGIFVLETMLYTLDRINRDSYILPNVTLGILAKDDCNSGQYGFEQAVSLIKGITLLVCSVYHTKGYAAPSVDE